MPFGDRVSRACRAVWALPLLLLSSLASAQSAPPAYVLNGPLLPLIVQAPENGWFRVNVNRFQDVWTPDYLEPYMGAMGHCAIISQDTGTFLHCHPEQLYPPTPDTRGGPVMAFHAVFPKPGRYKVWGQFQRQGRVIIADFVVDVHKPLLPANVVNFILND